MKLEFLGADHEVTGSCHYLKVGQTHVLIDCGMEQGADLYVNQEIPVNASEVDYVLVTHAHIDHSGLLPLLYNHGFRGKIYATNATTELCEIMLKTVRTSSSLKQNGRTGRQGVPEDRKWYRFMISMMQWELWSILYHVHMHKKLRSNRDLPSVLWTQDTC